MRAGKLPGASQVRQRLRPPVRVGGLHESPDPGLRQLHPALAMGAGKTILMGSIGWPPGSPLAMEYPDGPFVQNALIFARQDHPQCIARTVRRTRQAATTAHAQAVRRQPETDLHARDGDKQIPIVLGQPPTSSSPTPRRSASRSPTCAATASRCHCSPAPRVNKQTELANLRLQAVYRSCT